jgi:hypothetical protein
MGKEASSTVNTMQYASPYYSCQVCLRIRKRNIMFLRKYILALIIIIISSGITLWSQETPEWVKNNGVNNPMQYYYGIGLSNKSSLEADKKARVSFAENIEVSVASSFKSRVTEKNYDLSETTEKDVLITSGTIMLGISISERWNDSATHYSLIQIGRDEYIDDLGKELQRKLKRETKQLEYQSDSDDAQYEYDREKKKREARRKEDEYEEQKQKRIRDEQRKIEKLNQKRERMQRNLERFIARTTEYRRFLNATPPSRIISARNGELSLPGKSQMQQTILIGIGIVPFGISNIGHTYQMWKIESDINFRFIGNSLERQEFSFRFQLLPNGGKYYKTSISIGAVEYLSRISETENKKLKPQISPFVAANVTVPHWKRSYVSLSADYRKFSVGINNFILFNNFDDKVTFVGQVDYLLDGGYRNRFNDNLNTSLGIQLKTVDYLTTMITYEDHEYFILKLIYAF